MKVTEASNILRAYNIRHMPLLEKTKTPMIAEYQKTLSWYSINDNNNLGLLTGSPIMNLQTKQITWFGAYDIDIENKTAPESEIEAELQCAMAEIQDMTGIDVYAWCERSSGGHGGIHIYFTSKLPIMELPDYILSDKYKYISISCWGLRNNLSFYNMAAYPSVVASDYKLLSEGTYDEIVGRAVEHPLSISNHIAMISRWPVVGEKRPYKLFLSLILPGIWFAEEFCYKFLGAHLSGHGYRYGVPKEKIKELAKLLYKTKPNNQKDTTFNNIMKFIDDVYKKNDASQCVSKASTEELINTKYENLYCSDDADIVAKAAVEALVSWCRAVGTSDIQEDIPKVSKVLSTSDDISDIEIDPATIQRKAPKVQHTSSKDKPVEFPDIKTINVGDISKYINFTLKIDPNMATTHEGFGNLNDILFGFGDEGGGKSTSLGLDLALSYTTGSPLFGGRFTPINSEGVHVTYFQSDKFGSVFEPVYIDRFRSHTAPTDENTTISAKIDRSKLHMIHQKDLNSAYHRSFDISDPETLAVIRTTLLQTDSRILIIDTLTTAMIDIDPASNNDKKRLNAWLKALYQVIEECKCFCVIVGHNNKPTTAKDKPAIKNTYQGIKLLSAAVTYSMSYSVNEDGRSGTILMGKNGLFEFKPLGYELVNDIPANNLPDILPANFDYSTKFGIVYSDIEEHLEQPKTIVDNNIRKILRIIRQNNNTITYSDLRSKLGIGIPTSISKSDFYHYMKQIKDKKYGYISSQNGTNKSIAITDSGLQHISDFFTDEIIDATIPTPNIIVPTESPEVVEPKEESQESGSYYADMEDSLDIFDTRNVEDMKDISEFGNHHVTEDVQELCDGIDLEDSEDVSEPVPEPVESLSTKSEVDISEILGEYNGTTA